MVADEQEFADFVKDVFGSNNIHISFDHTSVLKRSHKSVHFIEYCIVYEMPSSISRIRSSPDS